jgi:outer membrane lipoprotein-sorting protein
MNSSLSINSITNASKKAVLLFLLCGITSTINAQANALIEKVSQKLALVNDYTATGIMKTDVAFIKASLGKVKVYFKKPNQLKIKKEGGISLLPKGGVSVSLNSLLNTKQYVAMESGKQLFKGKELQVIKLIPTDDALDWVISTLWIDPATALVYKTFTTTKENGTYEVTMEYGAHAQYGLPSKIIFGFNTKDYKLPSGITLEFGDEEPISKAKALKAKKGTIEITYSNYSINNGVSNTMF